MIPPNAGQPELTLRRRAQVVLDHVADIPVAILIANNDARYIDANAAATTLTGYSPEQLLTFSLVDLTASPDMKQAALLWQKFLKRGRMAGNYPLLRSDGRVIRTTFVAVAHVLEGIHVSALAHSMLTRSTLASNRRVPVKNGAAPSRKRANKPRT